MTGQILDFNQAKRQGEALQRTTVDADDIRNRLNADARSFVQWLYSGRALVTRHEARIGNVYGEPGASLSICLEGKDAGLWHDHATEQGGDLIGLYRACMGYTGNSNFLLSLKEIAKEFFNDPVEVEKSQWQPTASERIEQKKAKLGDKPRADMLELGAPVATYRYYDTRGNVTASVVRYEPDGTRESKTFRPYCYRTVDGVTKWVGGTPDLRPLYRIPEISLASTIVLTEGEGKADALSKIGIEATSAMQGANAPIEKTDWSPLYGKTVIVWPDNDEPGRKYANAVSKHLTALGVQIKIITPPADKPAKWDAFDCISEGGDPAVIIGSAVGLDEPAQEPGPLCASDIKGMPPARKWLVKDWLPLGVVSALYGDGGIGKTLLAQQLLYAAGAGSKWLGMDVSPQRGLGVFCEDEEDELRIRHAAIMEWLKTNNGDDIELADTWIWPRAGRDNLLVTFDRDNKPIMSPFFERIMKEVLSRKIGFLALDTVADLFGGNEIIRTQVNYFIKSTCGAYIARAKEHGFTLTVLLLAHPSQSGRESGRGDGGSTAWSNAVRSRLYLQRPEGGFENDRVLTRKKSNYAASGDGTAVQLEWSNGVIIQKQPLSVVMPSDEVCNDILEALNAAWLGNEPWSDKANAKRFAPAMISRYFSIHLNQAQQLIDNWSARGLIEVSMAIRKSRSKGFRLTTAGNEHLAKVAKVTS